jgi:hypothetical protein
LTRSPPAPSCRLGALPTQFLCRWVSGRRSGARRLQSGCVGIARRLWLCGGSSAGGRAFHFGWLQVGLIGADFGEFSARSYAKPVFRCVMRVSVIVAPEGILLIVRVANKRRRDQNDGYADDENSDNPALHFNSSFPRARGPSGRRLNLYSQDQAPACELGHITSKNCTGVSA